MSIVDETAPRPDFELTRTCGNPREQDGSAGSQTTIGRCLLCALPGINGGAVLARMCSLAVVLAGDFLPGKIPFPVLVSRQPRLDIAAGVLNGCGAARLRTSWVVFRIPRDRGESRYASDGEHGGKERGFDLHMLVFGFSVWTVDWIAKVQWVKLHIVGKPLEKITGVPTRLRQSDIRKAQVTIDQLQSRTVPGVERWQQQIRNLNSWPRWR